MYDLDFLDRYIDLEQRVSEVGAEMNRTAGSLALAHPDDEAEAAKAARDAERRRRALADEIVGHMSATGLGKVGSMFSGVEGGPSERLVEERRIREERAAAQRPPRPEHWSHLVAESAAIAARNPSVQQMEWVQREKAEMQALYRDRWNRRY